MECGALVCGTCAQEASAEYRHCPVCKKRGSAKGKRQMVLDYRLLDAMAMMDPDNDELQTANAFSKWRCGKEVQRFQDDI